MEFLVLRPRLGWLLLHLWLLGFFLGRVLFLDGLHQGFLPGIGHRAVALIGNNIRRPKGNAPLEEQLQLTFMGCAPVFITMNWPLGMDFSSSAVMRGRSIICRDWDPLSFPLLM